MLKLMTKCRFHATNAMEYSLGGLPCRHTNSFTQEQRHIFVKYVRNPSSGGIPLKLTCCRTVRKGYLNATFVSKHLSTQALSVLTSWGTQVEKGFLIAQFVPKIYTIFPCENTHCKSSFEGREKSFMLPMQLEI